MTDWDAEDGEPPRYRWFRGSMLLTVSALASLAGAYVWGLSAALSFDRSAWIGFGVFLVVMTVARPWWFWEHYKARFLRRLVGDELVIAFYLVVGFAMIWVGLFTTWTFGRR